MKMKKAVQSHKEEEEGMNVERVAFRKVGK